ncbi:MalY/PatB family protein [uncultured Anaeromusa sp.]|uniref:MalY/PatB family protein n=1 Tax=uncultured Anaeromusa sp. TaxID=673273 RepID=UPI0029C97177|nr:MalY/PatB family protein [uncultured Anaeromusa sp.]
MKHNFDELIERRGTECKKWNTYDADVIPMWIADTDFKCPQPVIEAMVKRAEHGIFGYPTNLNSFEQSIVNWQKKRFGWEVQTDWVEYTPAVIPAIVYAMYAFTNPGDNVVIQMPAYHPFHAIIPDNGRHILGNPLILREDGSYDVDFENLEELLKKRKTTMFLLCSPHNPTGKCFTREELTKMSELCLKYNVFVVSDEIHSDIIYSGNQHIPYGSLSQAAADNCVVCVNPSKTFNIAGVRTGAAIIPNRNNHDLFYAPLEALKAYGRTIFGTLPIEVSYNECEYYADQLLEYLEGNRKYLKEFLETRVPKIKMGNPQATYLMWLNCKGLNLEPKALQQFFLQKAKVAMNEGSTFGPGGAGFMRMNIACPRSRLVEALERIEKAVNQL